MLTKNAKMLRQLDDIKNKPVIECHLVGCKLKDIIKVCKAWSSCGVKIDVEEFEEDNIWNCVSMDMEAFKIKCGLVIPGTFSCCIFSGILYPDGTFNDKYLSEKILMMEISKKVKN